MTTNLEIKVDDDKKGKWQSFTASVDLGLPHLFNSEIEAYGADEKEAVDNLMAFINDVVKDINDKHKSLTIHKDNHDAR